MTQSNDTALQHEKIVNGYPTAEITPEQRRKWEDTCSMLKWQAPGFLYLMYRLLNAQNNADGEYTAVFTRAVPTAATDGFIILVNPDFYFPLSLPQRAYILGHKIIHNVFNDVEMLNAWLAAGDVTLPDGSRLPFDMDVAQRAMDARINALLDESSIGERPKINGQEIGVHDKDVASTSSFYEVYAKYYKKPKKGEGGGKPGNQPGQQPGGPGQGFDNLLKPGQATGKSPQQAKAARNPQQWAVELAAAQTVENMHSQGNMPAGLKRMFQELLEPEIHWLDKLETLVKRHVGDGAVNWQEPNPWLGSSDCGDFFMPAETGCGAGWVAEWGDTSGSMSDTALAKSISETAGLMDQVHPSRLTLIWGDAAVHHVEELAEGDDLRTLTPKGGGGTDYKPVLEWLAKNNRGEVPDVFIGFTDGYVSHPKKPPPFPVIWVCHTDAEFPFGQVIRTGKRRDA